jgi:hypothetical protein
MGFMNATVYGMTDKVKSAWRDYLHNEDRDVNSSHPAGVELTEIKRDRTNDAARAVQNPNYETAVGTAARGTVVSL